MNWVTTIILTLAVLGAVYFYRQHRTRADATNMIKKVMPLWASFAPFKDGHHSATIMYYCVWAIDGKKVADGLEKTNAYKLHADTFNRNPKDWEEIIMKSSEMKIDDYDSNRRLVVALFELDSMKQEGKTPEWESYYALGKIITSKNNEMAITFFNYLNNLHETNKVIDKEVTNLITDYVRYTENEIDITMAAGFLCYVVLGYATQNPDVDISKEIVRLKNKTFEAHREYENKKELINVEVDAFAESHPFFDELSGDIHTFIREGMSLDDAYYRALKNKQGRT